MTLNNEEISDPCQPNLLNMPKLVMEELLRNLDCPSIFRLRKVCRDLRFSIDEIKPNLHLHSVKLEIPISASSIEAYWDHKYKSQEEVFMKHGEPQIACILEWKQGDICKRLQIPIKEAENLLKNPKSILDCLNIDLLYTSDSPTGCSKMAARFTGTDEDLKKFHESMKSLLKNEGHLLRTKKIRLHVHDLSEATDFLKCIDPKSLKTISIRARNWHSRQATKMNFSELETLEQWENAEELEMKGNFILTPVKSFSSFDSVTLCFNTIQMEKLNEIKELFLESPKMKNIIIKSDDIYRVKDQMLLNFGQFDSYDEQIETDSEGETRKSEIQDEFDDNMLDLGIGNTKISTWTWLKDITGSIEKLQIILRIISSYPKTHIEFLKV